MRFLSHFSCHVILLVMILCVWFFSSFIIYTSTDFAFNFETFLLLGHDNHGNNRVSWCWFARHIDVIEQKKTAHKTIATTISITFALVNTNEIKRVHILLPSIAFQSICLSVYVTWMNDVSNSPEHFVTHIHIFDKNQTNGIDDNCKTFVHDSQQSVDIL